MSAELTFELPPDALASEPPEARGIARDSVRLLVATPRGVTHAHFADLPRFLEPGDLLVVNTSATLPAAVDGLRHDGRPVVVHFSTPLTEPEWVVELRPPGRATGPEPDVYAGERLELPDHVSLTVVGPYRDSSRLWRARIGVEGEVAAFLKRHGRAIRYSYVPRAWPISAYQTVFAQHPGSAEMPSAARPFTPDLVTALVAQGVVIAPITLHAGVSSLEAGEPPAPERFSVPASTASLVNLARDRGRRIVAVGTTVTRALETVADEDGRIHAAKGWTELVLGPRRDARVVTGLVTGWHEPGASHLDLLEVVAGRELVTVAYEEAVRERYRWHEFGDSCLLLP